MNEEAELKRRIEALEERVAALHTVLRWGAILAYFTVAWLIIPLAVYRWTGWHILSWWAMAALVIGLVLNHYLGVWFKHWDGDRRQT